MIASSGYRGYYKLLNVCRGIPTSFPKSISKALPTKIPHNRHRKSAIIQQAQYTPKNIMNQVHRCVLMHEWDFNFMAQKLLHNNKKNSLKIKLDFFLVSSGKDLLKIKF
jgi:hypothetical protein